MIETKCGILCGECDTFPCDLLKQFAYSYWSSCQDCRTLPVDAHLVST